MGGQVQSEVWLEAKAQLCPLFSLDDVIVVAVSTIKCFIKRFVGLLVNGIRIGSFIAWS